MYFCYLIETKVPKIFISYHYTVNRNNSGLKYFSHNDKKKYIYKLKFIIYITLHNFIFIITLLSNYLLIDIHCFFSSLIA